MIRKEHVHDEPNNIIIKVQLACKHFKSKVEEILQKPLALTTNYTLNICNSCEIDFANRILCININVLD